MNKFLLSVSSLALVSAFSAATAQDAPPGAAATGCDLDSYSAVVSERTGEVLYWNNPTCPAGPGATDAAPSAPPESSENGGDDPDSAIA